MVRYLEVVIFLLKEDGIESPTNLPVADELQLFSLPILLWWNRDTTFKIPLQGRRTVKPVALGLTGEARTLATGGYSQISYKESVRCVAVQAKCTWSPAIQTALLRTI